MPEGSSAVRPTNGLYLYLLLTSNILHGALLAFVYFVRISEQTGISFFYYNVNGPVL